MLRKNAGSSEYDPTVLTDPLAKLCTQCGRPLREHLVGGPTSGCPVVVLGVRMSDHILLRRMGVNGAKWAAEFRKVAKRLGYSDMDEDWLIGWFANAIEAGRTAGEQRARHIESQQQSIADPR